MDLRKKAYGHGLKSLVSQMHDEFRVQEKEVVRAMKRFRFFLVFITLVIPGLRAAEPNVSDRFYDAIRADDSKTVASLLVNGVGVNTKDDHGTTPLMYAAAVSSVAMMRQLIAAGADVNAKNSLDATALLWCTNNLEKVKLLTEKGADVNARSKRGRTPLLIAAAHDGNRTVVELLLKNGADLAAAQDNLKSNPLLEATAANDTATIKLLLEKGIDVNEKNAAGLTALMLAARDGNAEIVKSLIARGAAVNAQSADTVAPPVKHGAIAIGKLTPLLLAVTSGSAETVRILLDAGADTNATDVRGMTPLMLAVATDHPNDATIAMLLARGAATKVKSKANETALDWEAKFRDPSILAAVTKASPGMKASTPVAAAVQNGNSNDLRNAVQKSVGLLETSSKTFFKESGCVSCHAQNITMVATAAACRKGIHFDQSAQSDIIRATRLQFAAFGYGMLERLDPPAVDILTYALFAMSAQGTAPDRITDMMIHNIAAQQHSDGSWSRTGTMRPPITDGGFSTTALAALALREYAPPGRKDEMEERIQKAAKWLLNAKPRTTEDAVMQLLGAKCALVNSATIEKLAQHVLALQHENGGWAQTPYLNSDAYATGTALYALSDAGVLTSASPAYRRGVAYLLSTQAPDGSWFVASRAPKFQPYFEAGFPYGHDQWISQMATGWASAALSLAIPSLSTRTNENESLRATALAPK
jgi:ankyrin repeat protein